jgi:nuclear GTP-binding protein
MYNDKPDKFFFNLRKAMWKQSDKPARIDPNRKWFGNVRTISQKDLETFRSEMNQQVKP